MLEAWQRCRMGRVSASQSGDATSVPLVGRGVLARVGGMGLEHRYGSAFLGESGALGAERASRRASFDGASGFGAVWRE